MGLRDDKESRAMSSDLREEILKTIPEKIPKIISLVSLSMNAILVQTTISRRRELLREMASGVGVDGAYAAILGQIMRQDGEKGKLGIGVIMWVSQSERPLAPEELRYALAIGGGRTEPDLEDVPTMETTLSCCLGLATVDEGGSRVRLIHLTLEEYLGRHPDLFSSSHPKMAEVCLTYLNSPTIQNLPHNLWEHLGMIPFLNYASCYWGAHARKALTEHTKSLALQLLDGYDHHVSAKMLQVNQRSRTHYDSQHTPSRFSGLHAIACFGIAEIATALIKLGGYDVNGRDSLGCTPLMWATRNNNSEVCEVLLELGDADPNIEDSRSETPLLMASEDGYEAIVKLLLARKEVNPNSTNNGGQTPPSVAAQNGHKDIVKLLLEREEVNHYSIDNDGQTPLSVAARNGHQSIVKLLRERKEVNSDSPDNGGQTVLSQTTEDGHEDVVERPPKRQCINPGTPEDCIQKTSSALPPPSDLTHAQETTPLASPDNGFQPQSRVPKDGSGDPKRGIAAVLSRDTHSTTLDGNGLPNIVASDKGSGGFSSGLPPGYRP